MYQETAATGQNRLERELFLSVLNMHVTKMISNEPKKNILWHRDSSDGQVP